MIAEWSNAIMTMFRNDVFGDIYLMGAFMILAFSYFGMKKGMSFDAFGIGLAALVIFLAVFGFLPKWVTPLVIIILGAIIALGIGSISRK